MGSLPLKVLDTSLLLGLYELNYRLAPLGTVYAYIGLGTSPWGSRERAEGSPKGAGLKKDFVGYNVQNVQFLT